MDTCNSLLIFLIVFNVVSLGALFFCLWIFFSTMLDKLDCLKAAINILIDRRPRDG